MVIQNIKTKQIFKWLFIIILLVTLLKVLLLPRVKAADSVFQVDIRETLTVEVTTPNTWASATPDSSGTFLQNTVGLTVSSNNTTGFTAMMHASSTSLTNVTDSSKTIAPLPSTTQKSSFQNNKWGYSLDATTTLNNLTYNENNAGNNNSYYHPIVDSTSTPISILTGTGASSSSRNIYFGAKADLATASGTYTNTIVLSVVTGTVDTGNTSGTNPTIPSNPATPADDTNPNGASVTSSGVGSSPNVTRTTVYTTVASTSTTTAKATEISTGDNTAYYASPHGVTTANTPTAAKTVTEGTPLATGLAVTSAIAAITGIASFAIAKHREGEEDKDEY